MTLSLKPYDTPLFLVTGYSLYSMLIILLIRLYCQRSLYKDSWLSLFLNFFFFLIFIKSVMILVDAVVNFHSLVSLSRVVNVFVSGYLSLVVLGIGI